MSTINGTACGETAVPGSVAKGEIPAEYGAVRLGMSTRRLFPSNIVARLHRRVRVGRHESRNGLLIQSSNFHNSVFEGRTPEETRRSGGLFLFAKTSLRELTVFFLCYTLISIKNGVFVLLLNIRAMLGKTGEIQARTRHRKSCCPVDPLEPAPGRNVDVRSDGFFPVPRAPAPLRP